MKNTRKRCVQTGGLFSGFRRRIRTQTQKLMNRNPLGYIAQFKKVFPDGEITGTGYRYLIMGYGEILNGEILNGEIHNITKLNDMDVNKILNLDNDEHNKLITKLWNNGKLGILLEKDNNQYTIKYKSSPVFSNNKIISQTTNVPVRILIYKPSTTLENQMNNKGSSRRRRSVSSHT